MSWLQSIEAIATAVSAILAAAAIIVSVWSVTLVSRQNEMATLLDLLERYENYSYTLGAEPENESRLWNLINFVEQMCLIYNHRLGSKHVLAMIEGVATDFLAGLEFVGKEDVLQGMVLSPPTLAEIQRFRRRHAKLIAAKKERLGQSAFVTAAVVVQSSSARRPAARP